MGKDIARAQGQSLLQVFGWGINERLIWSKTKLILGTKWKCASGGGAILHYHLRFEAKVHCRIWILLIRFLGFQRSFFGLFMVLLWGLSELHSAFLRLGWDRGVRSLGLFISITVGWWNFSIWRGFSDRLERQQRWLKWKECKLNSFG